MILIKNYLLTLLSILLLSSNISGQLSLSKIFSNNMVLQCNTTVPIWGNSTPNSIVLVKIGNKEYDGTTDSNGKWKVEIPAHKPGVKVTIKVSNGKNKLELGNVVFGDVWLCGGQSNMEWYVEGTDHAVEEIANSNFPNIRLFDVPRTIEPLPSEDLAAGVWKVCSPSTVPQFSAVGYYFGRNLSENIDHPIGLIGNNYGGTIAEAWTSEQGLSEIGFFDETISNFKKTNIEEVKSRGDTAFDLWLSKFKSQDKGMKGNEYEWQNLNTFKGWGEMELPMLWESSADTSLYEKDGVVWFSKTFDIEKVENAIVSLGPIDDSDITWINGIKIGETYNQFNKDRTYVVDPSVLIQGANTITVRVEDYVGGGGLSGDTEKMFIQIGENKISLNGSWKYKKGMIIKDAMPSNSFSPNNFPTCLYNGMIAPITDFPIKGVIWYQGESNSYRAHEYKTLFPILINDWRSQWGQPEMPFIFVQLANFGIEQLEPKDSEWAELREAQEETLSLPETAMITTIDIGNGNNIHPTNKQEVGKRLANAALSNVYNLPNPYQGPTFKTMEVKDGYIEVTFDHVGDGLQVESKHGYVYGFTIAGKDGKYVWAKGEIVANNKVKVWSLLVSEPISLRYAWQNNPDPINLKNSHNLPAFPFRTDDYTLSTFKIKRF